MMTKHRIYEVTHLNGWRKWIAIFLKKPIKKYKEINSQELNTRETRGMPHTFTQKMDFLN